MKLEKENKDIYDDNNDISIPVHSILKTVKELPDDINEVNVKANDLVRENSKRSLEKKNVIINEDNNNYIEDISMTLSALNEDNNSHCEYNKIHNKIYKKEFVSDTDINNGHADEFNKFNNLENNEIIDSNKTLSEKNEITDKSNDYIK